MGIAKSFMTTTSRSIFNRMSGLFKDSPRLQGLVATGANIIAPDGPDKSATSNALVNLFKEKELTLLRNQLSNGSKSGLMQSLLSSDNKSGFLMKAAFVVAPALSLAVTVLTKLATALKDATVQSHNKTPLGDLIESTKGAVPIAKPRSNVIADFESPIADDSREQQQKETELQQARNPSEPARAGTDLMSLLQINSVPNIQDHSKVDPVFTDWTRREKVSRGEFEHTERQLREKQNIVYMLQTDLRNDPGNPEIERRLTDATRNAERAQELHVESMDKRHAIVEQGKMFGHQAETLMASEPVPEDWNRPKDFIPDNWDQPADPSR